MIIHNILLDYEALCEGYCRKRCFCSWFLLGRLKHPDFFSTHFLVSALYPSATLWVGVGGLWVLNVWHWVEGAVGVCHSSWWCTLALIHPMLASCGARCPAFSGAMLSQGAHQCCKPSGIFLMSSLLLKPSRAGFSCVSLRIIIMFFHNWRRSSHHSTAVSW